MAVGLVTESSVAWAVLAPSIALALLAEVNVVDSALVAGQGGGGS